MGEINAGQSLHKRQPDKLSGLPSDPGVYLMKDAGGGVIYVGKAQNLKKRVSSYFKSRGQSDAKTIALVKNISDFEIIITGTEQEALILESNLIKQYRPRYNVILKDDKRYPFLKMDIKNPYPDLVIVRKIKNDGALYFGPFASPAAVRTSLKIIGKTFKLRKCATRNFRARSRPCINYQMGRCLAPCCIKVEPAVYNEIVKEVALFLKGRTDKLLKKLKKQMAWAAERHAYEKAAVLRDRISALEKTLEKQVVVTSDLMDRDVLAVAGSYEFSLLVLIFVRGGHLLGRFYFDFAETMSAGKEIIRTFIKQYYEKTHFVPKEILVSESIEDVSLLENRLKDIKGEKVNIIRPRRGEKARLVDMAMQNAENRINEIIASKTAQLDLLGRLSKKLKLNKIPERIECFDNSNISGTEQVAGMVVFKNGKPDKSLYRKYSIKTVVKQNDYACMFEVLKRRYSGGNRSKPYPDLLMVDGGRGQLNIAVSVIKELNIAKKFEIIAIAKKNEKKGETKDKVYKQGRVDHINFGHEEDLLYFLQRIRDESHRVAVSFHRRRRSAASIHSVLDTIPGIGKKRKVTLLKHFKSISRIRAATIEELAALPGINQNLAADVLKSLK